MQQTNHPLNRHIVTKLSILPIVTKRLKPVNANKQPPNQAIGGLKMYIECRLIFDDVSLSFLQDQAGQKRPELAQVKR